MFTFSDRRGGTRRDFLRVGGMGLAGMAVPNLLRAASTQYGELLKDRSVIFLFLHGGPSQLETFDPKMTAPAGVRSVTGETPTCLPGVTFGSTFEKLAKRADRFSVVRSFTTGNGNHDIKPIVCKETLGANLGSLYARVAGANHAETGMPTNAALFPRSVDPETQKENLKFGNFSDTGPLGKAYAPFSPGGSGNLQEDMRLLLDRTRLDDRRNLLGQLDSLQRQVDSSGMLEGVDRFQQQAFNTVVGGIADAFDLSKEKATVIERYDTAPLVRPDQIDRKWNNYNNYVDNAKSLGKLLLLARRLCQRGCGFVTVTTNFVWDMHSDKNNAGVEEGMRYMGHPLDHALSAYLDDVESQGLSDKILLVVCGEMGRSPKVNKNGGRDHWGRLAPLLMSGGGVKPGQVIGQSTADAGEPLTKPFGNQHLAATVLHSMIDISQLRIINNPPRDVLKTATAAEPIDGLLS